MFAHTPVKTRQANADLSHWSARESEAMRNAEEFMNPNSTGLRAGSQTGLQATQLQGDGVEREAGLDAGAGQPLAQDQREFFESQFGRDFSQVRVHADSQAAQLADEASATAFTTGNRIVFGAGEFKPGTAEGSALMAHELTHVAQQSGANGGEGGATQCEPKRDKTGPGNAPPSESVIFAKGIGPEDGFVLFDQDSADVSMASEKSLAQMLGGYTMPVTVELHGYASREGDTDYNTNLSGHRAAALKAKVLALLPPDSKVILYARGETQAFGATARNRRVGIRVVPGAPVDIAKEAEQQGRSQGTAKGRDVMSFDPVDPSMSKPAIPKGLTLGDLTNLSSRTVMTPTVSPYFTLPPLGTPGLLDWAEARGPFIARGLRLEAREAEAIEQNFWRTYTFLRSVGLGPELAAWGANKGPAIAYDNILSRESPNASDRFDQEWEKNRSLMNPGVKEFRTPIVPILTPGRLEWLGKKLFNKDWKLTW